jgi:hypothetical protein
MDKLVQLELKPQLDSRLSMYLLGSTTVGPRHNR